MSSVTNLMLIMIAVLVAFSMSVQAQEEEGAPDCPTNLNGYPPETGGVFMSWTLNSQTDVNVYRDTGDGEFVFVERLDFPATRWIDHDTEEGQTYRYQVTAIDDQDRESEVCDTLEVTTVPDFPTMIGFVAATVLGVAAYTWSRRR